MTPEEFAQLQPGDVLKVTSVSILRYYTIESRISDKSLRFTNGGYIVDPAPWSIVSKAKKEMRFEIGKQYKNINKQKIHTCIAFTPEGWPILRGDPSYTNVIILKPDSHVKDHWEEYIPPVVHKRYVHWYRTHSESDMYAHNSLRKLENIGGCPILHVQEVSFEEKRDA